MIRLNKTKRIGSVVFVVEGKKEEPRLIRNIFKKILGYDVYQYNKQEDMHLLKTSVDPYNKVVIVTNNKPQIKCVLNETEYIDNVFNTLINHNLDPYNSAIYYIFDRDNKSNLQEDIISLMGRLKNSRENDDYEMNGLLLINYPCIESFYMNSNKNKKRFSTAKEVKKYVNEKKYKKLDDNKIIISHKKMIRITKQLYRKLKLNDLDNFYDFNTNIIIKEDELFNKKNKYETLSLFVICLIDLGIIEYK